MYTLKLFSAKGHLVAEQDLGTWRDHAVGEFKHKARHMTEAGPSFVMILTDSESGEILAQSNEEGMI